MEKQELIIAARCAKEWVEMLAATKKRPQAFHALLKNMSQQILDTDGETLVFTLTELVDSPLKAESNTAQGKAFSKFDETFERFFEGLREFAIDHGFDYVPAITMDKSQRVNVASFAAVPTPKEGIRSVNDIPAGAIRYTFEEKHQLWRLFGFLSGLSLRAWPIIVVGVFMWFVVMGGIFLAAGLVVELITAPSANAVLELMLLSGFSWWLFRWFRKFDRFVTTRIALAHDMMARMSAPQSVVILKPNETTSPTLEVISAMATCPICDGTIRLCKPHFESSHEIIGACRAHPTEHCFTFDHTTRLGWPITETARRHGTDKLS
ncbi:hypothetical protein CWI80_12285 [Pseudidiomarina sediminum]|uniref:Uncharacterized protein n=1 Tax=Pseudidiomarina sediminum TaxID=431675 RepID=A0A432YZG5_9GAMM|nr:hypothetical protein [Pseudidiomarina sediminum]RUO69001.1 hypothetical protein CWI80_12285 [Pseudidiomarina sediminum]